MGRLDVGLLGLQLLAATTQPGQPDATVSQLARELVAAGAAVFGVLGRVDLGGLGQHPLNLLADR